VLTSWCCHLCMCTTILQSRQIHDRHRLIDTIAINVTILMSRESRNLNQDFQMPGTNICTCRKTKIMKSKKNYLYGCCQPNRKRGCWVEIECTYTVNNTHREQQLFGSCAPCVHMEYAIIVFPLLTGLDDFIVTDCILIEQRLNFCCRVLSLS